MKFLNTSLDQMLTEISANFSQKLVTLVGMFVSASVFKLCIIYNRPFFALASILIFYIATCLAANFVFYSYIRNFWMILSHFWKTKWLSKPPLEFLNLANQMGVSKKIKIGLREGIRTAYSNKLDNSIVFDKNLFYELNKNEVLSIAAHEMHHLSSKTPAKYIILQYFAPVFAGLSLSGIPDIMLKLGTISAILVFMIPISWNGEHLADKAAADIMGAETFISALKKVVGTSNPNEPSLSHPSLNERIKKILSD